jgi:sorbitol/mannitol transport system substrate-binding protein
MNRLLLPLITILCGAFNALAQQKTVTIATVFGPDMNKLKELSTKFEQKNSDIKLEWVMVEWNALKQLLMTDFASGRGKFDVVFLGLDDIPIFAKRGWLRPMERLPADYDVEDVFKSIRDGLSYEGQLYALPFYGESSILMYERIFSRPKA